MGAIGRNVALLAAASFLADVSGEMLMAVLPFLLVAQGAGGLAVGLVGGATEAVGHGVKVLGGLWADRAQRRKPLVLAGYLLAAVSRVGIALVPHWTGTLAFRAADRVGKGLRTAPRDALLAESAEPAARGRAFGLHRASDTAGAVVGVAAALALLAAAASPSTVVLVGALAGLLAVAPVALVRDAPAHAHAAHAAREPASPRYRAYLAVAALFALGQVSYLFYMLRAADHLGETGAVWLYLLFNVVYATGAYPAGLLADRWGKPRVLAVGFVLSAASAAALLVAAGPAGAIAAFALLGLAFAHVDGTMRAFAADLSGAAARGTRLGIFHGTVGLATLVGGVVAGILWSQVAPAATFAWGAVVALLALLALVSTGFLRSDA